MALYQQKGSRKWWVSIYRGAGVPRLRTSTGTEDRDEAAAIEAALRRAARGQGDRDRLVAVIDALLGTKEPETRVALAKAWETYAALPEVKVSATMLAIRRSHLERCTGWVRGRFPNIVYLDQVTRDVAMRYMDALRPSCKTAKTYNDHRADLRTIWQALRYRAGLAENVWDVVPRAKGEGRNGRAFTADEVTRLLQVCRELDATGEWYGASLVALYTGLRQGDVVALDWGDLKDDRLELVPSKTARHKTRVVIPLHPALRTYLAALPHRAGPLFPGLAKRGTACRREYAAFLVAAGLASSDEAKVSFHSWRHTFRTRLAEAGAPADVAKKLGGWSTDIDQQRYNHDLTQAAAAIARLPGVAGQGSAAGGG